jgi:hypothetical protein
MKFDKGNGQNQTILGGSTWAKGRSWILGKIRRGLRMVSAIQELDFGGSSCKLGGRRVGKRLCLFLVSGVKSMPKVENGIGIQKTTNRKGLANLANPLIFPGSGGRI